MTYPAKVGLSAPFETDRWRPFVHWLLDIPHLAIAWALGRLRQVLVVISFFAVVFTTQIPKALYDAMVMTYRYQWRAFAYLLAMHPDYPPFDFTSSNEDDGADPHTTLAVDYPSELKRWAPLYKWFLAIPHYFVLVWRWLEAIFAFIWAAFNVLIYGSYPERARNFLVAVYRYGIQVQAYVGLLTDEYPPFSLTE
jgi:hypothetical protein